MFLTLYALAVVSGYASFAVAQSGFLQVQNLTFNSSYSVPPARAAVLNLTAIQAHNFATVLNFERSNYVHSSSVRDDDFYTVPSSFDPASPPPPGTVLKVEKLTNISEYTIPPSAAMSRFMYTSETLNRTSIPATAAILWPYTPRSFQSIQTCKSSIVFPTVGLAHGTVGQQPDCAPSHVRSVGDFSEAFALVLNGYAVVMPDYAGLGIPSVISPYFVLPTQANDLFHSISAAQKAFPALSKSFVIQGQSQGGGVTWAAAQRQVSRPVEGYLGAIAASPFTDIVGSIEADAQVENNVRVVGIAQGLKSVLPTFELSDWLTDIAIQRLGLAQETGSCTSSSNWLFQTDYEYLKPGWNTTDSAYWYFNVSDNARKPYAGPMLVVQGDIDGNANVKVTAKAVNDTCAMFPQNSLHYIQFKDIGHIPVLYSAQHVMMDWIHDRFSGVEAPKGCVLDSVCSSTGDANGAGQNWILEYDQHGL